MSSIDEVRKIIEAKLVDVEHDRERLQDALAALDGAAPETPNPRRHARRKRAKPSPRSDVVPAGKLEMLLASTDGDGLSTARLAEQTNANPDQVLTLLREAEAAGTVRRTGERRGTRWHLITDEDRIQQRAAELSSRSKRG